MGCLALLIAGCKKKTPSAAELRRTTHDMVAAAQTATGHHAEVAIRPEFDSSQGPKSPPVDNIYVTLADGSAREPLEQQLNRIALQHGLTKLASSAAEGVLRIDFGFDGRITHSVHIVTPIVTRIAPQSARPAAGGKLAIVLDDLGYDRPSADAVLALRVPLTISVLPNHPLSTQVAEEAHRRGYQVLLHLPMASGGAETPAEDVELRPGMTQDELASTVNAMLDSVPYAVGINNHQGSLATADAQLMDELMRVLASRGMFFLDSRTTAQTVAYDEARRAGVRAAFRNVFLDDVSTEEAVTAQLHLAEQKARKQGWAIAIGHPHAGTIAALDAALPHLDQSGIRLVFVSELVQ